MHGQNIFLNQPLAIDKNYLLSTITNILSGYQQKNFSSAESILQHAQTKIDMQASSAQFNGADVFPVVLEIKGPIIKYSSWYYLGTQDLISILRRLDRNSSVSGIVLDIDSGGGMVSGTAELTHTIKNLSKPTLAYTGGYMCSAAMDIASGADFRMANPFADLIGSIGTMLTYQDFSKMFEKWGATIYEIYAPQSSEKNAEFRALTSGDQKPYEEKLKAMTTDFISRMQENLTETLKDDGHVMKGKTYSPKEALSVGLINELGTLDDALAKF